MAGGKLSARQRMINLMYLVFIAMMAMQMSKEVLTAFGNMKEKFSESNTLATESNESLLANLILKGEEKPDEFLAASGKAQEVSKISNEFYSYLEGISNNLITIGGYKVEEKSGKYDYEKMADDDIFNESWFNGDSGLTSEGQEVVDRIEKYKADIIKIISPKIDDNALVEGDDAKYLKFIETFERRFNIDDVYVNKAETTQDWLFANFHGFPAVAIYTKLAAMQNDIKVTETALYNLFLGNTLTEAVTLKNYQAIVLPEKGSFFTGETFKGKVALGKYASVAPIELVVNQQDVNLNEPGTINEDGSVELKFNVGSKLGDQPIDGTFTFYEDGEPLEIPIIGNYVVVNKPNKATISADKLNVVYVGIDNELTISVPGVNNKDVTATARGLKSLGNGKYTLNPTLKRGEKPEVKINVSATLEGGDTFNDSKIFEIYGLPTPVGKINNKSGGKLTKEDLTGSKLIADLGNFPYQLKNFRVTGFSFQIEGRAAIDVQGERLNQQAIAQVKSARRGSRITISDITTTRGGLKIQFPSTTGIVGKLIN